MILVAIVSYNPLHLNVEDMPPPHQKRMRLDNPVEEYSLFNVLLNRIFYSMPLKYQEPTETQTIGNSGDVSITTSHPAFGQVVITRSSGNSELYGSDFIHHNTIRLEVRHSEQIREISHTWNFPKGTIVEFELSEAQWATLVSAIGMGSGVPCTIRYTEKDGQIPHLPRTDTRKMFDEELKTQLAKMSERIKTSITEVEANVAGLSKAKRDAILNSLHRLEQDVRSSLPYIARQFDAHMETTVEKSKTEIHAYMNNAMRNTGLAALNVTPPPMLDAGETYEIAPEYDKD
jgi:hypothetical protein